jgi:hypothetical protein
MNRTMNGIALAVLVAAMGCEKRAESSGEVVSTGAGSDVDRAVAVVKGIEANRTAAESVLAAHQLTADGFDSLMYVIASDSAKSAAYTAAIQ